jgi:hypothetical protein
MSIWIFLDSNIFYDKWHLDDPHFQLLFNFIKNSGAQLIISELVCEEVDNLYLQKWQELVPKTNRFLKELSYISPSSVSYSIQDSPGNFSLKTHLNNKSDYSNLKFIPYKDITQKEVVYRAIQQIKPFQDGDKGYRDTLIWLSFLQFLKTTSRLNVQEISFISNNKSDFYEVAKNSSDTELPKFFSSLQQDINDLSVTVPIKPYLNLASFIKTNVPADEHEFSYKEFAEKFIYPIELDIEREIQSTVNALSSAELERNIDNWHHNYPIRGVLNNYKFNIIEGMEDTRVTKFNRLGTDQYYVNLSFTLRRCEFIFSIDSETYFANKTLIDKNYDEVEISADESLAYLYFRPYLEITINLSAGIVYGMVINKMQLN